MPTNRLAAIMFTDIVGYTAMMQHNRVAGMQAAKTHNAIVKERLVAHKGELIQTMGDGSLSIFDSASAALKCAKEIQEQVRDKVPLRIGLHVGEVTIDGEHIFGDGVNIASRIESMGQAGTVLFSKEIHNKVQNLPEFETQLLGKFAFKNVTEDMEVYALANEGFPIPDPKSMKGKGAFVGDKLSPKFLIRAGSIGFVAMLFGALAFWFAGMENSTDKQLILSERVAAIPFNNHTSDANLDDFGALCSSLITNGLTEAGVKTCSPRTVEQYQHLVGVLPNNPKGNASFSEVVGARYYIDGSFLQKGKELVINSQLIDAYTGEVVRNFPKISGSIDEKEALSDRLTRRIMGFWVAKEDIEKGKLKAPLYEAFQEYYKGFRLLGSVSDHRDLQVKHSRKAFGMDSTFYLAALQELFWVRRQKRWDTLFPILENQYENLTVYEKGLLEVCEMSRVRDWDGYIQAFDKLLAIYPKDPFVTENSAWALAIQENMPYKAWEIEHRVDLDNIPKGLEDWRRFKAILRGQYGLMTQQYDVVIEDLNTYLKDGRTPLDQGTYFMHKSLALVRSRQMDSIPSLMEEVKASKDAATWFEPDFDVVNFCNHIANELLVLDEKDHAYEYLYTALTWVEEDPTRISNFYDSLDLAKTYRLLGQHEKALSLSSSYIDRHTKPPFDYSSVAYATWTIGHYLSGVGIDYALSDNRTEAEAIAQKINAYGPFRARVYAAMGDKEKAMKCLYDTEESYKNDPYGFQHDYFMQSLRGYAPFEEFIRPKDKP